MRTLEDLVASAFDRYHEMYARGVQAPRAWRALASRLRLAAVGCAARERHALAHQLDVAAARCDDRARTLASVA